MADRIPVDTCWQLQHHLLVSRAELAQLYVCEQAAPFVLEIDSHRGSCRRRASGRLTSFRPDSAPTPAAPASKRQG